MIDKIKFTLFSIVVLGLLGLLGYWAITSLQSGSDFKKDQKIADLQKENDKLNKQISDVTTGDNSNQPEISDSVPPATQSSLPSTTNNPTPSDTSNTYKNQSLINDLQKIVDANVVMKLKVSGSSVGSLQEFLNLYNKTSNKIDNDYGATTKKLVAAFQKDEGLTADGNAGSGTFKKMIGWLKAQG